MVLIKSEAVMSKRKKDVFKEGVTTHSINLLWVNSVKVEDQKYIYPAENVKELEEKLFNISLKWAKQNKKADVKIWYDFELITDKAAEDTEKVLSELLKENELDNITFHDIRKIKFVNDNEVLFTQDMGVYFRVDYLKLIILAYELINSNNDGAVYTDLRYIDAFDNKSDKIFNDHELFDSETIQKLKESGMVLGGGGLENQFIQVVNDELAVNTLRHIINVDALRAINTLNAPKDIYEQSAGTLYYIPFGSTIGETYKLYKELKAGTLEVNQGFLENKIPDKI